MQSITYHSIYIILQLPLYVYKYMYALIVDSRNKQYIVAWYLLLTKHGLMCYFYTYSIFVILYNLLNLCVAE